jgi:four helix bundle protein
MKSDNIVEKKSFDFAVRVVNLYKYLTNDKKELVLSKQLLRSGTSIGANICESQKAQSTPDFTSKLYIALKEANETSYWLRLLHKTEYLTEAEFKSLNNDIDEIIALLMSITKSVKNKN